MKIYQLNFPIDLSWSKNHVIILDNQTNECIINCPYNQNRLHILQPRKLINDSFILCADFLTEIYDNSIYYHTWEHCKSLLLNCEIKNMIDVEGLLPPDPEL